MQSTRHHGFCLIELLLAASLGLLILAATIQALLAEQRLGRELGGLLRQRQQLQRANALIAADLRRALTLAVDPMAPHHQRPCSLAGRQPVLHIDEPNGVSTTYSVGPAPSAIWRGWVLMRCGQAFGRDGRINPGSTAQNRVVLDGLDAQPHRWSGCALPEAIVISGSGGLPLAACMEHSIGLVQWQLRLRLGLRQLQGGGSALING
ncbi:MAG: prepilin-type cleavage/methylation domain-containing protein [Cyanobium sp. NAT70]|nr:prepilin-type cleavage/methylation domain-containing protein [Cyanobium sp. NAT70]